MLSHLASELGMYSLSKSIEVVSNILSSSILAVRTSEVLYVVFYDSSQCISNS